MRDMGVTLSSTLDGINRPWHTAGMDWERLALQFVLWSFFLGMIAVVIQFIFTGTIQEHCC
jgi:hypothetical protein